MGSAVFASMALANGETVYVELSSEGQRRVREGTMGLSHPLLKFSGGSGDDYATIPDDSSSPS